MSNNLRECTRQDKEHCVVPESIATFPLDLRVTVEIGRPMLVGTGVSAPVNTPLGLQEGQISTSPPAIDTASFDLSSLSKSTFTWKAALSLALASKLAYESEQSVKSTCLGSARSWGFSSCEFIDVDETQCFVALTPEIALVAFRGTESRGDWLRNINVAGRTREYGVTHRGFLGAFQAVESRLRSALSGIAGQTLILTGHSLGGALATVMAAEWQHFMPASWGVTFGQPAVGRGSFRMFFSQNYSGKFFRFVNDDDIVPRVPPGYEHVGRLLHFDAQGRLQNGQSLPNTERAFAESINDEAFKPGPPMLTEAEYQGLQSRIGQEVVSVNRPLTESHTMPQTEGLIPSVSDHSLDKYIAKIAAKANL
ncbi:lipase class 3 [Pirellula staleyi DSM 6068]|uniref:Lipase class 3 n=1 Tax=Pirellula staleyi (strain ATCC 27377 / DSM 6068 / ICPB 4128) TaxID=530564 RepID=D2R621_PIRSD|nr:lipase class 3 [Pirellula staleyi DSM 6068]